MSTHTPLLIIGSGPAAHTAAIYAARADLHPILYEGFLALGIAAGGQLTTTDDVENYPGFKNIKGGDLMNNMREQSEACGVRIVSQTVGKVDLDRSKDPEGKGRVRYWIHPIGEEEELEPETHTADAVVIATGAKARRLNLDGEEKYWGSGVSACAVCDGSLPMFRAKHLIVIGGGDSAVEESVYLSKKASHVTVLVRRGELRASKANAKRLLSNPKITVKFHCSPIAVVGEEGERGLMSGVRVRDTKSGSEETIEAKGLFYAVGHEPATGLFKGQLKMDEDGYLVTEPGNAKTGLEGVFAAGDVADKRYRQAITSAGTGCIAALEAEKWLAEQESADGESKPEDDNEVRKGKDKDGHTNGDVPEYRSNPLL